MFSLFVLQLNASYGLGGGANNGNVNSSSNGAASGPGLGRPIGMGMGMAKQPSYGVAPPQPGYPSHTQQQQPQPQGLSGLVMMPAGPGGQMSSALAPSMLSATAPRKAIPTADAAGKPAFSFCLV